MSWELYVYDPIGSSLLASYSDTNPGPIVGGFAWSTRPGGGNVQMRFTAVPSGMPSPIVRSIVQLRIDGTPVFWGTLTKTWPSDEDESREYVALGGEELLSRRYLSFVRYDDTLVEDVVNGILAHRHPATSIGQIDATGYKVSVSSPGPVDLKTLLDDLAKKVGYYWGVNASGEVFFVKDAGQISADYQKHGLRWLPVEADDMATKVLLWGGVIEGGGETRVVIDAPVGVVDAGTKETSKAPGKLLYEYEAPEHATYGLERAYAYPRVVTDYESHSSDPKTPAGQNLIKLLKGAVQTTGGAWICAVSGSVDYTYDEFSDGTPNNNTGLQLDLGEPAGVYTTLEAVWTLSLPDHAAWGAGWSLLVTYRTNMPASRYNVTAYVDYEDPENPGVMITKSWTPGTKIDDTIYTWKFENLPPRSQIRLVFTPDPAYTPVPCSSGGDGYINIVSVLGFGGVMLGVEDAAPGYIVVPAQTPREVVYMNEIATPAGTVEVVSPTGTSSGAVRLWEYVYAPESISSRARLESDGASPSTRSLRLYVDRSSSGAAILGGGL